MKQVLLTALLFLSLTALAQSPQQVRVKINHVTVFLNGAELTSAGRISLPAGESDVLFTNVAGNANQQSLVISAGNDAVVQSATFQNNYLNPADSTLTPRGKMLKDSLEHLSKQKDPISDKMAVIAAELAVLETNRSVAGANTGLSVDELEKLMDMIARRMTQLLTDQRELVAQGKKIDDRMVQLTKQLDEERKKDYQPGGQLLVRFFATKAINSDFTMTYVVPGAGWTPAYDLRVDKVNDPVQLFYKANVYQNCGVKWDNVSLSLSTGNPNEGVDAPILSPWTLTFNNPMVMSNLRNNDNNGIQLNRAFQTTTVTGGVPGYADGQTIVAEDISTLNQHTEVDNSGINTTFDIDLPYSIPSDGQQHTVAIKNYELPATYRYFAVPKMDRDAFLQAQITNWEDLNLLPAITNVFFEGTYVGQGFIDMRNVRDTMNLSLGRDKKIIIRRERDKNYQSEHTVGTNERQSSAYTISIRNTRKETVKLVILEQFPLSSDDDIVIEDKNAPDATIDDATGAVRWIMELKPNELRKVHLSYTVKHPKGKPISNLR